MVFETDGELIIGPVIMPDRYPTGKVRNSVAGPLVDFLRPESPFRSPVAIDHHANDNLPRPANDNARGGRPPGGGGRDRLRHLPKAMRVHPVVNAAMLAFDLYTLTRTMSGSLTAPARNNYWAGKGFTYIRPGLQTRGKDGGGWQLGNHSHPVLNRQFAAPKPFDDYTWLTAQAIDWYTTSDEYLFLGSSVWDTYNIWHKDAGTVSLGQPWKLGKVQLPAADAFLELVAQAALVDPTLHPVFTEVPWPHPKPLPYRVLPHRKDTVFRVTEPKVSPRVATGGASARITGEALGVAGGGATKRTLNVGGGGKIEIVTRVGSTANKPPGRNTKEKKKIAGIARNTGFGRAIGRSTEVVDFVEAVYKGLPGRIKHKHYDKRQTPMEKARLIYRYAHLLDINVVVRELLMNELEDFLIGRIGKRTAKANRALKHIVGVAFGPVL